MFGFWLSKYAAGPSTFRSITAESPPGRVQVPKSPVLDTSTKTVFLVSSFMNRRKDCPSLPFRGRKFKSMMLVGDLSMRVWGAVNVLKSLV